MLNRRHIRIKVMQTLYAFKGNESDDIKKDEKFLLNSLEGMYDLYLVMMSLMIEIQKKAEDHLRKSQKKLLATAEEKNPNERFINNEVLLAIKNNVPLKMELESRKIDNWYLDFEYVDILHKAIIESDVYAEYMANPDSNFNLDKQLVVEIFSKIIAPNEKLYEYIEDKNLTWIDDLPVVNTAMLKLLKKVKPSSPETHFVPDLYKDEEDKEFAVTLFRKTLLNGSKLNEEISSKTKNWDSERITSIDAVLMRMAISEFLYFSSIPVKVTINEYLEIAKEYSTPKSSIFINGILDKLVKEYKEDNKLNKIGRGLM